MTKAEAAATGLTTGVDVTTPAACGGDGDGFLRGAPAANGNSTAGKLFFSINTGQLVAIYAYPGVLTTEGIGLGSTYDDLHAAYPEWSAIGSESGETDGRGYVQAGGQPGTVFRFVVSDGRVTEVSLERNQDCYE